MLDGEIVLISRLQKGVYIPLAFVQDEKRQRSSLCSCPRVASDFCFASEFCAHIFRGCDICESEGLLALACAFLELNHNVLKLQTRPVETGGFRILFATSDERSAVASSPSQRRRNAS